MKYGALACILILLVIASFFLTRAIHSSQTKMKRGTFMAAAVIFYVLTITATVNVS